jgi:hypothetical protein
MVHASLWMSLVYELVKAYGLWVLFIGITLECMGIPVPGETVLVSAALYAGSTHRLTIGSVMLVAATAAIAGGMIGYAIGHWIGLRLLVRYGKYIKLDEPRLKVGHTAAKRPNKPAATGSTGCRRRWFLPRASARMPTSFLNCRLINQARGLVTRAVEIDYHAHNIRWTKSRNWRAARRRKGDAGPHPRCPFIVLPASDLTTSEYSPTDSAQPFMWLSAVRLRSTMRRRDVGNSIAAEPSGM